MKTLRTQKDHKDLCAINEISSWLLGGLRVFVASLVSIHSVRNPTLSDGHQLVSEARDHIEHPISVSNTSPVQLLSD